LSNWKIMQPSFATLWANHPAIKGNDALLDKDVYKDQCAINVGAAFIRSSLSLESFPGISDMRLAQAIWFWQVQ